MQKREKDLTYNDIHGGEFWRERGGEPIDSPREIPTSTSTSREKKERPPTNERGDKKTGPLRCRHQSSIPGNSRIPRGEEKGKKLSGERGRPNRRVTRRLKKRRISAAMTSQEKKTWRADVRKKGRSLIVLRKASIEEFFDRKEPQQGKKCKSARSVANEGADGFPEEGREQGGEKREGGGGNLCVVGNRAPKDWVGHKGNSKGKGLVSLRGSLKKTNTRGERVFLAEAWLLE